MTNNKSISTDQLACDNTLVSCEGDHKAIPGYKIWWIYCVLDSDYWCWERVISRCCSIWYKLRSYSPIGPSKYPCLLLWRVPFLYAYYADSCCSVQIKPWNWSCCNAKNSTLKWSTKLDKSTLICLWVSMSFCTFKLHIKTGGSGYAICQIRHY